MNLLNEYSQASGQHLSLNKFKFYSGNMTARKSAYITGILGFSAGALPFNYLEIPLFKGLLQIESSISWQLGKELFYL